MSGQDETFMSVALQCAALGLGAVEPNPMVGAVIVRDGVEIARGWHRRFGGPHAEIEALRETGVSPVSENAHEDGRYARPTLRNATMYVTLEPCCHRGKKTPPCTEALIPSGISRVVVAMEDPDVNVRGRGIAALRAAGIEVTVGVCEAAAKRLLEAYIKLRALGRPWVIAKWAQTADGYLALPAGQGRWISNELSRAHVHEVRGICDAVLVGIGTVLADDPMLTNREVKSERPGANDGVAARQPARVVLDCDLRIPIAGKLVQTVREFPLLIVTSPRGLEKNLPKARLLRDAGAEVIEIPEREAGRLDLGTLLNEMGRRQWTRVLVEGGPTVLRDTLDGGLADELMVYVSSLKVGVIGEDLPRLDIAEIAGKLPMTLRDETRFGEDRLVRYCGEKNP